MTDSNSRLAANGFLGLAAANGFIVVLLGAFGAHALKGMLGAQALETWETSVHYHMFHVVALLGVQLALRAGAAESLARKAGFAFQAGIVLFCGSLYALAFTQWSVLGWITPFGGLAFLIGWALLFRAAMSK